MKDLFNYNTATARRNHPITSHKAADTMNRRSKLQQQQLIVLEALRVNNGVTAKHLGVIMGLKNPANYSYPHKRMKELESQGLVSRWLSESERELRCHITPKGMKLLMDTRNDI